MSRRATFRFYAELNDFLPSGRRFRDVERTFEVPASVKDMIEALGVPHTEVDMIVIEGGSVGFDHLISGGERVSVYPVFESFDISPVTRLRPSPLRDPRFVLDANLGRLARYLRLLGFDSLYRRDLADDELAAISADEDRALLTRDRGVLKRSIVTRGYFVRETDPRAQLLEVVRRFDLAGSINSFTRCMNCNGLLVEVDKESVAERLQPGTRARHDSFRRCESCGAIFWEGSHHGRLAALVEEARGPAAQDARRDLPPT